MNGTMTTVLIGLGVLILIVTLLLIFKKRRDSADYELTKTPGESRRDVLVEKQTTSVNESRLIVEELIAKPSAQASHNKGKTEALYRNLLVKYMHDKAKVDRMIEYERASHPHASKEELMQAAIDRWEHDNR